MATTSIWGVSHRLSKVLHYIENPEKTHIESEFTEIQKVLHYAADPFKTEQLHLVSGVSCTVETALLEMNAVKEQFGKNSGRIAYHGYQSFKPGEVTPNEAHEMGIELASRLWGDRLQVVVATHIDQEHIHNHFVLNSVSFIDGIKYRRTKKDYAAMQRMSDEICREYGKSVIDEPKKGKHYAEHFAEKEGRPTQRLLIATDLDAIIAKSFNLDNFYKNLTKNGYSIHRRGKNYKHVSISPPGSITRFRLDKLRGNDFTDEAITERIKKLRQYGQEYSVLKPRKKICFKKSYTKIKLKGFRALYFKYLLLLGKVGQRQAASKIRHACRKDVIQFKKYKEQFEFLDKRRIETAPQLEHYTNNLKSLIVAVFDYRNDLYRLKRQGKNVGGEIEYQTIMLRELGKEERIIKRVQDSIPEISDKFKMIEEERKKELTQKRSDPKKVK